MTENGTENPTFEPLNIDEENYANQGIVRGEPRVRIEEGREDYRRAIVEKSIKDTAYAEELEAKTRENELIESEKARLNATLEELGFSKKEFVRLFPAFSDKYINLCRARITEGILLKTPEQRMDALFVAKLNAILSLIRNDADLFEQLSGTEAYEKASEAFDQEKRRRERS
jgi:hypothetical protein